MRVAGVRVASQSVEDEDVKILEEGCTLRRDVAHVGEICCSAEAITCDLLASVRDRNALEARAEEIEAHAGGRVNAMHLYTSAGGIAILFAKGVIKDSFDIARRGLVRVDGQIVFGVKA